MLNILVVTIVPLLFPTLYIKSGIFTSSLSLWVFHPLSFHCYHVHLPCFIISVDLYILLWYKINLISVKNSLITYGLRSKVLVERSQRLLAQTHSTLTRSPITFSIRFSSSYKQVDTEDNSKSYGGRFERQ